MWIEGLDQGEMDVVGLENENFLNRNEDADGNEQELVEAEDGLEDNDFEGFLGFDHNKPNDLEALRDVRNDIFNVNVPQSPTLRLQNTLSVTDFIEDRQITRQKHPSYFKRLQGDQSNQHIIFKEAHEYITATEYHLVMEPFGNSVQPKCTYFILIIWLPLVNFFFITVSCRHVRFFNPKGVDNVFNMMNIQKDPF